MKALVLTYDKYKVFADHTIYCYEKIWPENPFTYHIPYQDIHVKNYFEKRYGDKVKMIKSPSGIRDTMDTLLVDMNAEEWIYWCMDDRYLIEFHKDSFKKNYEWIRTIKDTNIAAIKLVSRPGANTPDHINYSKGKIRNPIGQSFYVRKTYSMIWIHQFMRVKVLKDLFSHIPRDLKKAKDMDYIVNNLSVPNDYRMYSLSKSIMVFGESTNKGKITQNCYQSLIEKDFKVPTGIEVSNDIIISGENKNFLVNSIFNIKWLIRRFLFTSGPKYS